MIEVTRVRSGRDRRTFRRFPYELYRGDAVWVPPLRRDVKFTLSEQNPFWRHAEGALFLARRDGEVVGRVAAIEDGEYIKYYGERCGYFGFFECREDEEAAAALWDAAADWLRGRGLDKMLGPMNPSTNEECAFLVEGFERPPFIMMTHNPRYYTAFAEGYGFRKAKDMFAFIMDITPARQERLERVAAAARRRTPGLVVRDVSVADFVAEVELVRQIYNRAWEANWGFVPATRAEFESTAKRLKSLVEPRLVSLATVGGDAAGFIMSVPNYNEVLIKMGGTLGPRSLVKFLRGRRKIKSIRLMLFGLCPEYRKRGVDAALLAAHLRATLELGFTEAEISWVLEENELTKRAARMMGGRPYKKYRLYEKEI